MATQTTLPPELFPEISVPPDTTIVNDRCVIRTQDGHRVVIVAGVVIANFAVNDRVAESYAMVNLIDLGWANQNDIAAAFACSPRTIRRYQGRYEAGGLGALGTRSGFPKGRCRLPPSRLRLVTRLKNDDYSNREIAQRIGVTEKAVRKLLRRAGWSEPLPIQPALPFAAESAYPNLSAFSTAPVAATPAATHLIESAPADSNLSAFSTSPVKSLPVTFDTDPANRRIDRFLAYLGLLEDAAPLFATSQHVPHAGVLLALPAIIESGVLDCAERVYRSLGPSFYGLRTTLITLLLMALLRIKRPEALKEHSPRDLGRLLGLDRAPEVKTIRRKLAQLAAGRCAVEFGRALARHRVARRGAAVGFLYVDGHVRVYYGKRTLPKTHVAQMRLPMPATSDYWVNDTLGEPLFVITAEANAGLIKMLPLILREVRALLGDRRVTIVFDRGGWSPRLFKKLIAEGFDILTYRKGRCRQIAKRHFKEHTGVIDGRKVKYMLADQNIRLLGGTLRLRQVTILKDGHQTPIITSRRDLTAVEVAFRIFERWRQENFFKYLIEEYALDALTDYDVESDDASREVPNPAWRKLDAECRAIHAAVAKKLAGYGDKAFGNIEGQRPTMRGFKIAHAAMGREIRVALARLRKVRAKRAATPKRVAIGQVVSGQVIKLAPERKHLLNLIKMVAYQAESDLVRLIVPHYKRAAQEGRTLVQNMLSSAADLEVTKTELRVTVAPLSSAHRTRALLALCDELNRSKTIFPGTQLCLRYAIRQGV